jgi:hypothetical protein
MMMLNIITRETLRKIIKLIERLSQKLSAIIAKQYKSHKKIAKNVKLSLQGISAKFANFSTMTGRKRKYSIVKAAVFVVLAEEKTSFTVTFVNAARE